jgi:hypothetical protein
MTHVILQQVGKGLGDDTRHLQQVGRGVYLEDDM